MGKVGINIPDFKIYYESYCNRDTCGIKIKMGKNINETEKSRNDFF